jgi:hypothetical protein
VLVQNPGDEERSVTMTLMETSGKNTVKRFQLAPRSRHTVATNTLPASSEFSARVAADGPIIVEKSIYFNGRSGGTCSIGVRGNSADSGR